MQKAEGGVAGADAINTDLNAPRLQLHPDPHGGRGICNDGVVFDLQHQVVSPQVVGGQGPV